MVERSLHRLFRGIVLWRDGVFPERHLRRLAAFERLPAEAKRRRSFALLQRVVHRAYENVPYYRTRFDRAGFHPRDLRTREDLGRIPLLEKEDINEHRMELMRAGRHGSAGRWDATGGSTGEPLRFFRSRLFESVRYANDRRTWRWYGVHPGARRAWIWGADQDVPPDRAAQDWRSRLLGICRLNAFLLDDDRCRTFADILDDFQPTLIYGYATALARFAAYLRDAGRRLTIQPRAIRSTAEVLLPEHRALIQQELRAPVYDYYGSREAGPVAGESPDHDGLHVFNDVTFTEILRPDGTPCDPGEVGDIVVTKLHEHVMPFIRYRIGDRAAPLPDSDEGRGFPRITPVEGRVGDFVVTPDGRAIHGEFFTHLFYGVEGITRFQVRQPARDRLHILVQGRSDAGTLERIRAASAERFGASEPEAVRIEVVPEIRPGPSGKHRFILPYRPSAPSAEESGREAGFP